MAILVEGIDMPKNCDECPLNSTCVYSLYMPLYHTEKRHSDCPLIEVPEPHGRLIDAEKLKSYWAPDHSRYFDADYFIHTIDVAQTIIPASEEEVDEAQRDYHAAADYQQYCETYEQTYDPETGAM